MIFHTNNTSELFHDIPNLEKLYLRNCKAQLALSEPSNLFTKLQKLTFLDLSYNAIHRLNKDIFEGPSRSLKILIMENNQITRVNITSLPTHWWTQLDQLNLIGNPWICDCGIVWFRSWLRNPKNRRKAVSPEDYRCSNEERTQIISLKVPSDIQCFQVESDLVLYAMFTLVAIFYCASMIGALLHRYRWHARYFSFLLTVC